MASASGVSQLALPVALVLVVLVVAVFVSRRLCTRRSRSNRFVLVGSVDAGKTTVFYKLVSGKLVDTITSMVTNEAEYRSDEGAPAAVLVDFPGTDRLRAALRAELSQGPRGVILVLDAAKPASRPKDAELLYDVLALSRAPVLVCCHKSDLTTSTTTHAVRAALEDELTRLQKTRTSMADIDNKRSEALTDSDRVTFDQLAQPLRVAATTVRSDNGLLPVVDFVRAQLGR